jgi:hypothetical protein
MGRVLALAGIVTALMAPTGVARAQTASQAFVRIAQAAPLAEDIDVYIDGTSLIAGFQFGNVSQYMPVDAGARSVQVVPAGKVIKNAIIRQNVTLAQGKYYTLAAVGDSSPAVAPVLIAFEDDNTVEPNQAKIRLYHLSDNAGPAMVKDAEGAVIIPNLGFEQGTGYLTVAPGDYTYTMTLINSNTTVKQPVTAEADKVTSVICVGEVGGSGGTVFKAVVQSVSAIPTGLPQTGVAPGESSIPPIGWLAIGAFALLALGEIGQVVARRRGWITGSADAVAP